ncbi:MAG TPA: DegT/DnrJ/EryC1/StrS family aminotransferase [Terriglobales bacterium]|nr:DegT/DnrJ/EryC1/StrS family aminotransferase [Terriglobales bacterium]
MTDWRQAGKMQLLQRTRPAIPVSKTLIAQEEEKAVVEVLRSGWLAQGPRVAEFERAFAEYVGAAHAIAVSSCTAAVHLTLLALGVMRGDEVLCPSLSLCPTADAVRHAGASLVFVDVSRDTCTLDARLLEESITPRARAVVVAHQVGMAAPLSEMGEVAARHGLYLIEDAGCAIGSMYDGSRIGAPHSNAACFSFYQDQLLTTGEGGMITTSDTELAGRIRRLRHFAIDIAGSRELGTVFSSLDGDELGFNTCMTDLQAAIGIAQLSRLDHLIARRRELADRYTRNLRCVPWLAPLLEPNHCRSNYQSYIVRLSASAPVTRNTFIRLMRHRRISVRRGMTAVHRETPFRHRYWDDRLPETNAAAERTMILPLYHDMTEEEHDYIVESIIDIAKHAEVEESAS